MSNKIVTNRKHNVGITKFKAEEAKRHITAIDVAIKYAKDIRDWSAVEKAVDLKIAEQAQFVVWWDKNVTARKSPGRSGIKSVSGLRLISVKEAEELTGIKKAQVWRWRNLLKDPEKYRQTLCGPLYTRAMADSNTMATHWTGDPESYTPAKYIEAARTVMNAIDLDPASNAFANKTVKAVQYYDEETDGLQQEWRGRVFLNPPYRHPDVAHFIEKLVTDVSDGTVTAAVLLTNNNTDTKWWHLAIHNAAAVCFTRGRINFYQDDGTITQPTNGQCFFYFGKNVEKFEKHFGEFGTILKTHKQ